MNHLVNPIAKSDEITERVIRFNEMIPCTTAFIDARTPGSDQKENFCLIGGGVAENPGQVVHIDIPHGFNVGAARQPQGCKNSHHSHDTEEVFMIFSGSWQFTWGEDGSDGSVTLRAGDTISIPTQVFRGFENVGKDQGFMFAILGLGESGTAGNVLWAPYVFEQAKDHGLVLLEDGRLIDTAAGEAIPEGAELQGATTRAQADALQSLSVEDMNRCVVRNTELTQLKPGGLSSINGIEEIPVIGPANPLESIGAGKMAWKHGFHMRRVQMNAGAIIPAHSRAEEEVIIVQKGSIRVKAQNASIELHAGDLYTVPVNEVRSVNCIAEGADLIIIRRGNQPEAAKFA